MLFADLFNAIFVHRHQNNWICIEKVFCYVFILKTINNLGLLEATNQLRRINYAMVVKIYLILSLTIN